MRRWGGMSYREYSSYSPASVEYSLVVRLDMLVCIFVSRAQHVLGVIGTGFPHWMEMSLLIG